MCRSRRYQSTPTPPVRTWRFRWPSAGPRPASPPGSVGGWNSTPMCLMWLVLRCWLSGCGGGWGGWGRGGGGGWGRGGCLGCWGVRGGGGGGKGGVGGRRVRTGGVGLWAGWGWCAGGCGGGG